MENGTMRSRHKIILMTSKCKFTCRGFLINLFFPLFKILRCGMENSRHVSRVLIKHMKIFVVYNYEKLVITKLVESTVLTVPVVRRPREQLPLTTRSRVPRPRLKRRDHLLVNISRFPWHVLSREMLTVLPIPSVSTVLGWYIQPWGTTFCTGAYAVRTRHHFLSEQDLNQQPGDEVILLQEQ